MKTFAMNVCAILILALTVAAQEPSPMWHPPAIPGPGSSAIPALPNHTKPQTQNQSEIAPPNSIRDATNGSVVLNPMETTRTSGPVHLGAGDLLTISVFDAPELTTRVRVSSDGEITFPMLGQVPVANLTPLELQLLLRQQLIAGDWVKDPQVAVFLEEYSNQMVFVLGEVDKPGAYPIMGSHRLFDFIAAAGGLTVRADRSILITRALSPDAPESVRLPENGSPSVGNPDIAAGDTLYVRRAGVVYVAGEVNRPGGFMMDTDDPITVVKAVSIAEGTKSTAALSSTYLIRRTERGRIETRLDLKKILHLKAEDLALKDGDILYIPSSAVKTAFNHGMIAALQTVVGLAIYRF